MQQLEISFQNSRGDIATNQVPKVVIDLDEKNLLLNETSSVGLSSPVLTEQLTDTQSSNATTITLSSPEQTVGQCEECQDVSTTTSTMADKECQTTEGIFLSNDEYEWLLNEASFYPNFKNDLCKILLFVSNMDQPEMDPNAFEKLCIDMLELKTFPVAYKPCYM